MGKRIALTMIALFRLFTHPDSWPVVLRDRLLLWIRVPHAAGGAVDAVRCLATFGRRLFSDIQEPTAAAFRCAWGWNSRYVRELSGSRRVEWL